MIESTGTPVHDIVVGTRGTVIGPWFVKVPASKATRVGDLGTSATGTRSLQPEIVPNVHSVRNKQIVPVGTPGIVISGFHPSATVEDVHAFLAPHVYPATGKSSDSNLMSQLSPVVHESDPVAMLDERAKERGIPGPWLRNMLARPDRARTRPLPRDRTNFSRVSIPFDHPVDDPIEVCVHTLQPAGPSWANALATVLCRSQADAVKLQQLKHGTFIPATNAHVEQSASVSLQYNSHIGSSYRTAFVRLLP